MSTWHLKNAELVIRNGIVFIRNGIVKKMCTQNYFCSVLIFERLLLTHAERLKYCCVNIFYYFMPFCLLCLPSWNFFQCTCLIGLPSLQNIFHNNSPFSHMVLCGSLCAFNFQLFCIYDNIPIVSEIKTFVNLHEYIFDFMHECNYIFSKC